MRQPWQPPGDDDTRTASGREVGPFRDSGMTQPIPAVPTIEETVAALEVLLRLKVHDEARLDADDRSSLAPLINHPYVRGQAKAPGDAATVHALDDIVAERVRSIDDPSVHSALEHLFSHRIPTAEVVDVTLEGRGNMAALDLGLANWDSLRRRKRLDDLLGALARRVVDLIQSTTPGSSPPKFSSWELRAIVNRLNASFGEQARIIHLGEKVPRLLDSGPLGEVLPDTVIMAAAEAAAALAANQGLAFVDVSTTTDWTRIEYRSGDFATWRVLVSLANPKWASLGAYRVVADHVDESLHLLRRSQTIDAWPGALATPGGLVATDGLRPTFDETVPHTMHRQLREEIGPYRSLEESKWFCVVDDLRINRLQVVGLGGHVVLFEGEPTDRLEGEPIRVPLSRLEEVLLSGERWAPSARLHVLAWLGLGGPVTGQAFPPNEAIDIFDRVTRAIIDRRDHALTGWSEPR